MDNVSLSREMTDQEQKAWLHFFSGDPMFRTFVQRQTALGDNPFALTAQQPICPKCERPGFYHGSGMACNHCGYDGPIQINTRTYLKEGWWK